MKTIQLGNREFQFGDFTPETIKLLNKNLGLLDLPEANAEGKTDFGDVILFLLIAIFGDEEKAMEEGKKLEKTERSNVTTKQLENALDVLNEKKDVFCLEIEFKNIFSGLMLDE